MNAKQSEQAGATFNKKKSRRRRNLHEYFVSQWKQCLKPKRRHSTRHETRLRVASIGPKRTPTTPRVFDGGYCKPFGIIKTFETVSYTYLGKGNILSFVISHFTRHLLQILGGAFLILLSLPEFMRHRFRDEDTKDLILVSAGAAYALVGSLALLIHNLRFPTLHMDKKKSLLCGKQLNLLKIYVSFDPASCSMQDLSINLQECLHALACVIIYFMIRHFCARYYGGTARLHGRMLVLMVSASCISCSVLQNSGRRHLYV